MLSIGNRIRQIIQSSLVLVSFCLLAALGFSALGGEVPSVKRGGIDAEYFKALPPGKTLLLDLSQLKTGMPLNVIKRQVEYSWEPVVTNHLTGKYPLSELMPHTNRAAVSEWESRKTGERWAFIAVFSDTHKTNLVDAFLYQGGSNIQPMVDGLYQKALLGIRPGDSIEQVYTKLGRRDAKYFKGKNGKWVVELMYIGCEGEFILIDVDAASGTVTGVANVAV